MRKNIILLIMILFLTGCKVEYKINLDNDLAINENLKLIATTADDESRIKDFVINVPVDIEVDDYESFERKIEDLEYYDINKDNNTLVFEYDYDGSDYEVYSNSRFANMAFDYISIKELKEDELVLSTGNEFLLFENYPELDEIKIIISTRYKVLSHNADSTKNHNFIWKFTKENESWSGIYLKIDTSQEDLSFWEKLIRGDYLKGVITVVVVVVVGYILYLLLKKYNKNVNDV